jgi:3-oxoacyl-[acyl-carrier-protein] synthase-1
MKPVLLAAMTATSALGRGLAVTLAALREGRSALAPCDFETARLPMQIGEVAGVDAVELPGSLVDFACRNNRLAQLGLAQDGFAAAVRASAARHGADRVGVFLGTSTSGILATELAYRERDPASGALPAHYDYAHWHNSFSVTDYVRRALGVSGPAVTLSTACSSSAKAFPAAARMLAAGMIDAAVVGGVDSLCLTTLYGFHALQLTSSAPCRPFDVRRDGLSIGEAAAFMLLERAPAQPQQDALLLLGVGESADATCQARIQRARARAMRCSARSSPPVSRPPRSTTSICTAPARRTTTAPRPMRSQVCSVSARRAARPRPPWATRSARPARSRP